MFLTEEEQRMLEGAEGYAVQKSMEILSALGEAFDAKGMVPIRTAHLPGVSIEVAGEAGARFLESMAEGGGRFRVYTTTNICSIDFEQWENLGMLPEDYRIQEKMTNACKRMGAFILHSCTPYELGHVPRLGEHVAWGESSAVMYANSVLGARTNKEGGPSALAAAITGRVPMYGMHLDECRHGEIVIHIKTPLRSWTDYGTLGYFAGKKGKKGIVAFTGMDTRVGNEELKYLSASISSAGTAAMFHSVGVTPEAPNLERALGGKKPELELDFTEQDLEETADYLNREKGGRLDWIVIGCPHVSNVEIRKIALTLEGRRLHPGVKMWILSSDMVREFADKNGYTERLKKAGATLVTDTCPVVMTAGTLSHLGYRTVATNSAKLVNCMPGNGYIIHYGDLDRLIEAGVRGSWE